MKKVTRLLIVELYVLIVASTCFAQMYTVTDLGTLNGNASVACGINSSGQVVGSSDGYAFRTAPNSPMDPATDNLGTFGGNASGAWGVDDYGRAVGWAKPNPGANYLFSAFRTAPNRTIDPDTDNLGLLGSYPGAEARAINASGQVAGNATTGDDRYMEYHGFRTAANTAIDSANDDLGTLNTDGPPTIEPAGYPGVLGTWVNGISDSGQVVGFSAAVRHLFHGASHAFRTAPNSPINPVTDDLGTLGGRNSFATQINRFGQVVGYSSTNGDSPTHAFRTAPNSPINPDTDDLGTLGGAWSSASSIDDYGQVVGWASLAGDTVQHTFLYSNGNMRDLNSLIPAGSGCTLAGVGWYGSLNSCSAYINNFGQIAANGNCNGQAHAVLLNPIYKAFPQRPINFDGRTTFSARRGVVPIKFTLTENGVQTCNLPPATIGITRGTSDGLALIDESVYSTPADTGKNFRIDANCQYIFNLGASSLGVGTYRVDISIDGIMVGHAVFALE